MPSNIIYVGNALATLVEDFPATIEFDEDSIASGSLEYTVLWASAPPLVAKLKTHPDFPFMTRKSATITRMEAKWAKVKIDFEGVDPSTNDDDESARYSLQGGTSTEPIETHPKFAKFGGKPFDEATWENGAEFVKKGDKDRGKFLGFRASEDEEKPNKKAGVRSYLEASMTYTQTKTFGSSTTPAAVKAKLLDLGYIDKPPKIDDFADIDPKRDWLLITCNVEQAGKGITVTKEWRLSGRNGWDVDIYKK